MDKPELELPSLFHWFHIDEHAIVDPIFHIPLIYWVPVLMSLGVGLVITAIVWMTTSKLERVPSRGQAFIETIVEGLSNFFHSVLGDSATRYVPLLGSLFLYILVMNWWAQIPGMHAATSKLSTTVGLAVFVFLVVQYEGIRHAGLFGHIYHLMGGHDLKGLPIIIQIPLRLLFFPLHVVGELARPLSLSLRLFGNIMGEDTLIAVIVSMSVFVFSTIHVPLPLHAPLIFLGLLAGLIQALVFSLLSSIYIGGMVGAFEEHGHDEAGHESHGHG